MRADKLLPFEEIICDPDQQGFFTLSAPEAPGRKASWLENSWALGVKLVDGKCWRYIGVGWHWLSLSVSYWLCLEGTSTIPGSQKFLPYLRERDTKF